MLLPDATSALEVSPDLCFRFPLSQYPANKFYRGAIKYQKHFYELPAEMNVEEAECAVILDSLDDVKYWVRNLTRADCSFWLQTSSDKFYPDFVALLQDGRYLVVGYKGAQYMTTEDTKEKRGIGELWEARSNGNCIFRLIGHDNVTQILRNATQ
jgi:type III restriction enzyme